ncbi:MAG: hypothetical protein JW888_05460 [Pirellulales bacterium]|nr:hypothetical protein [Pirellulales bacterium]
MGQPEIDHDVRGPRMRRRTLLKTLPLMGVCGLPAVHLLGATQPSKERAIRYAGWQAGITYQAPGPGGMSRDELMRLLDEMALHRMNLLSLMMLSYAYFDPNHDGYCWPVRNPKLKPNWDDKSINGQPKTEFVGEAIQAAADRGIEVQLFMNWGIWNPRRIRQGYPTASAQMTQQEAIAQKEGRGWLHCPDSPGAWQAGLDEVADLLAFYDHPNVKSYCLERLSYGNARQCFCRHTQERYREDTGRSLLEADPQTIVAWKAKRIGRLLKQYSEHIHRTKPKTGAWMHTQGSPTWGHDPATMQANGIDCLAPHTIQFPETRERIYKKLRRLAPNPCVLHFCTRDQRPKNYKLWIKTPEILAEVLDWVRSYPGENLAGLLFFNPSATSPRNRQTVYEQLKRFHWPRG